MKHVADLERFIQERMSLTRLSAVSIAVVKDDKIVYQRGFGLANREHGAPATPETNYCIGSITKSFTCLSIMQLQERGLLNIDDPVDMYLPLTLKPFGERIRIRHLMSHTSGIPALAYAENLIRHHYSGLGKPLSIGGIDDLLAFVNGATEWVETKPGERWFYLNEGYALLGGLIEKITGVKYRDYVRENILLPLGMTKSYHERERFKADPDIAIPYVVDAENRFLPREYSWGQIEADGGLIANALDMSRYMMMYLNEGAGPQKAIVSPDSIRAMMHKTIVTPPRNPLTGEPVSHYGFGLGTSAFFGHRLVGHSGSVFVATAGMRLLPELNCGAVALANGSGYSPTTMADYALALLTDNDPWDLPALRIEKILDTLSGHYETYRGTSNVTVVKRGDYLFVETKSKYGTESMPLVAADLDSEHPRFHAYNSGSRITVEFKVQGEKVEMISERYKYRKTGKLA